MNNTIFSNLEPNENNRFIPVIDDCGNIDGSLLMLNRI